MVLSPNVLPQTGAYLGVREDLREASIWRFDRALARSAKYIYFTLEASSTTPSSSLLPALLEPQPAPHVLQLLYHYRHFCYKNV